MFLWFTIILGTILFTICLDRFLVKSRKINEYERNMDEYVNLYVDIYDPF